MCYVYIAAVQGQIVNEVCAMSANIFHLHESLNANNSMAIIKQKYNYQTKVRNTPICPIVL